MQNNLFFESIPLIIFFAVYYFSKNIFLTTAVCIAVCWVQVLFCQYKYKKITRNLWISAILMTIFGGLTIFLHNKTFIMLKPTALYWILAIAMIVGQLLNKNFIKSALGKEIHLQDSQWNKLNIAWSLFFIALGVVNLFVAFNYSEYTWVRFKVFGALSMLILFSIVSMVYLYLANNKNLKK